MTFREIKCHVRPALMRLYRRIPLPVQVILAVKLAGLLHPRWCKHLPGGCEACVDEFCSSEL